MKKYYCIGIKGSGMSTLAQILSDLGNEVSGYDDDMSYKYTEDGLVQRKIKIYYDHTFVLDKDVIVTASRAFSNDHPEIARIKAMGFEITKYNEIIGMLVDEMSTIAVSGTHGKTTTSSLISHVLENTIGCNHFIGAGDGRASKDNDVFVLEADEFNRHFLAYKPDYAIITNIELDHTECYKDLKDVESTFEKFASGVKKGIIAYGDKNVKKLNFSKEVLFYGFNEDNDLYAKNVDLREDGTSFDCYFKNELLGNFFIPLYGKHNVLNALSCILVCLKYNVLVSDIKKYLSNFHNAKKRFDVEEVLGCTFIDDYAHHPTEIKVTIDAVRQKFPNRRVVVVFLPNTYSRTYDLCDDFVASLSLADKVFVAEIASDREKQSDYPNITSRIITDKIDKAEIISVEKIEKLDNELSSVVCFLGCASTTEIKEAYRNLIKKIRG